MKLIKLTNVVCQGLFKSFIRDTTREGFDENLQLANPNKNAFLLHGMT